MSKKEKRKKRIMHKPAKSDIKFSEVHEFLLDMGFEEKNQRGDGSHRMYFLKTDKSIFINIQSVKGLVKQYQIKQIQQQIEYLEKIEKLKGSN